jgi:7-cyano-7-deazaguanine reductase
MSTQPSKELLTFPNPHPDREYAIDIESPEFTSLCPVTGQPDFATLRIHYVPAEKCVELKSLKLYLWSYRDEGSFHEDVTNKILNDLVAALQPIRCTVVGDFNVRGGLKTVVTASYERPQA